MSTGSSKYFISYFLVVSHYLPKLGVGLSPDSLLNVIQSCVWHLLCPKRRIVNPPSHCESHHLSTTTKHIHQRFIKPQKLHRYIYVPHSIHPIYMVLESSCQSKAYLPNFSSFHLSNISSPWFRLSHPSSSYWEEQGTGPWLRSTTSGSATIYS